MRIPNIPSAQQVIQLFGNQEILT